MAPPHGSRAHDQTGFTLRGAGTGGLAVRGCKPASRQKFPVVARGLGKEEEEEEEERKFRGRLPTYERPDSGGGGWPHRTGTRGRGDAQAGRRA